MNKNMNQKSFREIEGIVKGFANHRRIQILDLIIKKPELSVAEIANDLNINFKTASEHIRRIVISGLVMKRYEGSRVCHKITNRGANVLKFLRILE